MPVIARTFSLVRRLLGAPLVAELGQLQPLQAHLLLRRGLEDRVVQHRQPHPLGAHAAIRANGAIHYSGLVKSSPASLSTQC